MLNVDRRAGAIVFTGRMDRRGIFEAAQVLGNRLGRKDSRSTRGPEKTLPQIELRVVTDERLWKGGRLDQEEPVEVLRGELARYHRVRQRDDIEDGGASDAIGMLHGEAPRHARAAVVAGDGEAVVPECVHHLDLIERYGALRVVRVILAFRRLAAVAVSAEVHQHHCVPFGKLRRDPVPLDVRLRVAVNEQQRRTVAAAQRVDRRAGGLDHAPLEAGKDHCIAVYTKSKSTHYWRYN